MGLDIEQVFGRVDPRTEHPFASGVPQREANALYAAQRPIAFSAGIEPSGPPAWKTIPSWYVLGTEDEIITPSAQEFMAGSLFTPKTLDVTAARDAGEKERRAAMGLPASEWRYRDDLNELYHDWSRLGFPGKPPRPIVEDMLWRRSKLGLRLTPQQAADLSAWMAAQSAMSSPQRVAGGCGDDARVRAHRLLQAHLQLLEVEVEARRLPDRGQRAGHAALPVCKATIPPAKVR